MKKTKLIIFIILLFILKNNIFSNEILYKTTKDTYYSEGDVNYTNPISKNEKLYWKYDDSFSINYNTYKDEIELLISLYNSTGDKIWLNGFDLEIINSLKLFNSSYYQIIPIYYLEMLKQNKSNIRNLQSEVKEYKKFYKEDLGEDSENVFYPEHFLISNLFIYFTPRNYYLIQKIQNENDIYKIYLKRREKDLWGDKIPFYYEQPYPKSYMNHKDESEITLLIKFDGDYFDIWINNLNEYMGKYFIATRKTQEEISKLVTKGSYKLENVYWPRHADGTSDFDNKVISPMIKLSTLNKNNTVSKTSTKTTTPSTNVSVNKTMVAFENLKLRSAEATSSSVITVMSSGTKVKILQLGKAETIDGINSNWVKVEVQKGAKDRDGKEIKAGTVGWCYGGYLK